MLGLIFLFAFLVSMIGWFTAPIHLRSFPDHRKTLAKTRRSGETKPRPSILIGREAFHVCRYTALWLFQVSLRLTGPNPTVAASKPNMVVRQGGSSRNQHGRTHCATLTCVVLCARVAVRSPGERWLAAAASELNWRQLQRELSNTESKNAQKKEEVSSDWRRRLLDHRRGGGCSFKTNGETLLFLCRSTRLNSWFSHH